MACPRGDERAAFGAWLADSGLEPVLLVDACLTGDGAGQHLAAVVADAALLTRDYLDALRRDNPRLPVIGVGNAGDPAERLLAKRGVSFYPRPLERATLLLATSLALAEGRPARRSERRLVPRLPSRINGAAAFLLDVSGEGLRLEVARDAGAKLAPHFQVQVPMYDVGVLVRRVWIRAETVAEQPRVQCGAALVETDERAVAAWRRLLENAPRTMAAPPAPPPRRPEAPARSRTRPQALARPAKVTSDRLLGRVARIVTGAPILGALTQRPWRGRS